MALKTIAILIAALLAALSGYAADPPFHLMESSIAQIREAMQAGTLTCHSLVQQYLDRIEPYDKQGPAVNALLYVNPRALQQADEMDREFKRTGKLKPLGCIPIVLKDNFQTAEKTRIDRAIFIKVAQ